MARPRTLEDKKCETCDELFRPPNKFARYCSRECWPGGKPRKLEDKRCPGCGIMFHPRNKDTMFCTRKCAGEHRPRMPERACSTCGKMFAPWRKSSKYCSSECVPGKPRTYADRDCVNCGNSFHPKKNKTQRFCTRSCYIEHHDKNRQKRVDNGGYIIIYRPEYSDRQSGQMMEHRAVMSEFLGRKLETHETVHHKDGNKQNNDISNLQLRSGKHGKGAVFKCADCGSHNIIADSI